MTYEYFQVTGAHEVVLVHVDLIRITLHGDFHDVAGSSFTINKRGFQRQDSGKFEKDANT